MFPSGPPMLDPTRARDQSAVALWHGGTMGRILEAREAMEPEFDAAAFLAELDSMGMKLSALQLADGTFKVYRWRMRGARERVKEIEELWDAQVGGNQARIDVLAKHIIRAQQASGEGAGYIAGKALDQG